MARTSLVNGVTEIFTLLGFGDMQNEFIKIYQIYYDDKTYQNVHPDCIPLLNNKLTIHFENSVLVDAHKEGLTKESVYTGIFSHSFWNKNMHTPKCLEQVKDADLYSFFGKHKKENYYTNAERWHNGFIEDFGNLCEEIGLKFDSRKTRFVVYQNAFIAKEWVWDMYVEGALIPAIKVLNTSMKKDALRDSGYVKNARMAELLESKIGLPYYPMSTFLLERLMSVWLDNNKDIKAIQLNS